MSAGVYHFKAEEGITFNPSVTWKTWLCGSLVSLALAILGVYFK